MGELIQPLFHSHRFNLLQKQRDPDAIPSNTYVLAETGLSLLQIASVQAV
jgi:hypothetical protein